MDAKKSVPGCKMEFSMEKLKVLMLFIPTLSS